MHPTLLSPTTGNNENGKSTLLLVWQWLLKKEIFNSKPKKHSWKLNLYCLLVLTESQGKIYNQTGNIATLDGASLKLVNKFTDLGSSVSSTEKDIDTRLTKAMDSYR